MKTHIIWFLVSVTALLIGAQFPPKEIITVEKPVEVIKTKEIIVEKPVDVIREVPKEIEKIIEKRVEIPAEIPQDYKFAKYFLDSYTKAKFFEKNEILADIQGVKVIISLSDNIDGKITESELKDSIELALRKNGVPVNDDAVYILEYVISGLWDTNEITYSYSATMNLREGIPVFRVAGFKQAALIIWSNGYNGYAGKQKVTDGISGAAEKLVVSFSNAYLSANTK